MKADGTATVNHHLSGNSDSYFSASAGGLGIGTTGADGLQVELAVTETAQAQDNVRVGIAGGTPRIIFDDTGGVQWELDNSVGTLRFFQPGVVYANLKSTGFETNVLRDYNSTNLVLQNGSGNVGIGTTTAPNKITARNAANIDPWKFTSTNVLTGQRDLFTIEDRDIGDGTQDESSVLKVWKANPFNVNDDGSTILELTHSNTVPASVDRQFYALGRTADEGAVTWGVALNDADIWTTGSIRGGATGVDVGGSGSAAFTSAGLQIAASGFSYFNGGNLGVGVFSPTSKLHVGGTFRISGTTKWGTGTYTWPGADGTSGYGLTSDGSGGLSWTPTAGIWTDTGPTVYATTTTDNVGIGTATPSNRLHVYVDNSWGTTTSVSNVYNYCPGTHSIKKVMGLTFSGDSTISAGEKFVRFISSSGEEGSINSEVAYSTFTGAHIGSSQESTDDWRPGMLVVSRGKPLVDTIDSAPVEIALAACAMDPAVVGVFASTVVSEGQDGFPVGTPVHEYHALGEGLILVSDANGDIEIGDYLTSSDRPGYGMRQESNALHNYTVAKATEPVNWEDVEVDPETGFKWKLIACTYHGG
jgi:hypothetical protein